MKFGKITALALAGILTFAACKYEEGPRMSLRSKRDRVANEWRINLFTLDRGAGVQTDMTSFLNVSRTFPNAQDSNVTFEFAAILNFYRTGAYGLEIMFVTKDGNGNITYHSNHEMNFNSLAGRPLAEQQLCSMVYNQMLDSLPSPFKYIRPHGSWAFDKGHYKIEVKPDLGYVKNETGNAKNTIDWTIVKLAQKEIKFKGLDEFNRVWKLDLKAINKEPYFY